MNGVGIRGIIPGIVHTYLEDELKKKSGKELPSQKILNTIPNFDFPFRYPFPLCWEGSLHSCAKTVISVRLTGIAFLRLVPLPMVPYFTNAI